MLVFGGVIRRELSLLRYIQYVTQCDLGNPTVKQWFVSGCRNMGVSKNKGTPKWMVYNGKPY